MHSARRWFEEKEREAFVLPLQNEREMATHDHDISKYPGAPTAPIKFAKSEAEKDKAIDAFLAKLAQDNAPEDKTIFEETARAASAVMSGELKDANLLTKLQNAPVATTPASKRWETFRDETVKFLGYAATTDPVQVAIHYQVDNGFFNQTPSMVSELQTHITGVLKVPNSNGQPLNPGYFIERVAYLYRCASRGKYNRTMDEVYDQKAVAPTNPALLAEWELLKKFDQNRASATADYLANFVRYDQVVKDFYAKANGSLPALVAAAPAPQPPPANPIDPALIQKTQRDIKDIMDELAKHVSTELARVDEQVARITRRRTTLDAANDILTLEMARGQIYDQTPVFQVDRKPLVSMAPLIQNNQDAEKAHPGIAVPQDAVLQKMYQDAKNMYEDAKTGIDAKAAEANAALTRLKIDVDKKALATGKVYVDQILVDMRNLRDEAQKEAKEAKAQDAKAQAEFYAQPGVEYRGAASLERLKKMLNESALDVSAHASTIRSIVTRLVKQERLIAELNKQSAFWWRTLNVTSAVTNEAAALRKEIDGYQASVATISANLKGASQQADQALGIEVTKPAFRVPAPQPDEHKADERLNQANIWYHMFDSVRLQRTEAYRLDLIKNKKATPWPFNFESTLDVHRVLEAAVKTGKSNKVMDLKDKDNFYKTVDNLIMATCEELKVAPPQANTLNEKMLLFVATGASLDQGVQWVYANDSNTAYKFQRLANAVQSRFDANGQIKISDGKGKVDDYDLLTESRHMSQSAKAPKVIRAYEEAY